MSTKLVKGDIPTQTIGVTLQKMYLNLSRVPSDLEGVIKSALLSYDWAFADERDHDVAVVITLPARFEGK